MIDNLRDPSFIAAPYPAYQQWRQEGVVLARPARRDWLVIGFDEIVSGLLDPRLGHVETSPSTAVVAGPDTPGTMTTALMERASRIVAHWPMTQNPPEHSRLRQPFKDHAAEGMRPCVIDWIDRKTDEILDEARARGGFDVVSDLAVPLTLGLSCRALGIPDADGPALVPLIRGMEDAIDVDTPPAVAAKGRLAVGALDDYVRRTLRVPRTSARPDSSLRDRLVCAVDAGALNAEEASALGALSLLAGSSTTESLISSGVRNLLREPHIWRALVGDAGLLDRAVEECLRYDTPAQVVSRVAITDAEIGAQSIAAGETVRFLLGAGNRDPRQFESPERFDVRRERRRILSMGLGIHTCPGASQARHVARRVFQRMMDRVPSLHLSNAAPVWRSGFQVRSLQSLPVELEAPR